MDEKIREILTRVQKPGRYAGGETNIILKEHTPQKVSVALAYPDIYEVGMSYLGLRILYHLLNERDDVVCERVFAPWGDMEDQMRVEGVKLYGLETKRPLDSFDIIGFSVVYELTYTNILNMLDLAGVPLRSKERKGSDPLVIAGGACCYNPEPLSEFIDAFVIGDGEEVFPELVETCRLLKEKAAGREQVLRELSRIEGVYVPSLYRARYANGWFSSIEPVDPEVPERVSRILVEDLENAYYPRKQIVPLIRIVHDRIAVEIMRGCPNKCRFCQASAVNRPVRLRTPEKIREICLETYRETGYENIALLSLSSVNYPYLTELVRDLNRSFSDKGVGVSIPSLRVDEAFYGIPEMLSVIKKGSLTFAPETASEVIRESIDKNIDINVLCRSALLAYKHGWRKLKLYFMVGFPGQTEEAEGILEMAGKLSGLKKKVSKRAAEIRLSINPFVPKPHTPFQWVGMKGMDELASLEADLRSHSRGKVKVDFHDIGQAVIEACMARGDRRIAEVIFTAWEKGAKMDGWREYFDHKLWQSSFSENGLSVEEYARKNYSLEDELPWGHIGNAGDEKLLREEFKLSGIALKNPS
ncbi:MAG: TIGR03960 family B12-binding radical SAM protein [Candidatus Omnitrophica bacterium]|nr:TIGR03960 family B12-binding radical SAM protein [Candidatus Omnitrophota bacterium]